MSKVAVVYWSSTGNTEAMANAVADGIREKGGEAVLHTCEDFDGSKVAEYDAIAFGCPAMGDEVLEDTEFEPMFDGCKDALKGKNIALIPGIALKYHFRNFITLFLRKTKTVQIGLPVIFYKNLSNVKNNILHIRIHHLFIPVQ